MPAIAYPEPLLADAVVRLRPWRLDDVSTIEEASRDRAITTITTVPDSFTPELGVAWIERQWRRVSDGAGVTLAIADPASDEAIGFIGLFLERQRRAAIGYWVLERARGRATALRSVRLLVPWAFQELGIERLEITVTPDNRASQRVAERAGFRAEGLLRSYARYSGERLDLVMYSRLPHDPDPDVRF